MSPMPDDLSKRARVIAAAAEVYSERSIAIAGRRDVARAADLPLRAVSAVGRHRLDLLREVVAQLPFPPVAEHMAAQAFNPAEPALQALLRAARDVLGDPGAAWDPLEVQAIAAAPYDEPMRRVIESRLNQRWDAAEIVIQQLRGYGAGSVEEHREADETDESAALHLIAVGLGLAMLAPLSERWSDAKSWTSLAARLLEALAATEPPDTGEASTRWRARASVDGTATATAQVLRALSLLRVHVVALSTAPLADRMQLIDLVLAAPAEVDRATIVHAISSVGTDVIVARGTVDDASDVATRVLHLSEALVKDPEAAPKAAADLVLADSWEVTTAAVGDDASAYVLRLQWTPERHVVLHRAKAPFTRTEQNRASALLALVAALAEVRGEAGGFGWRENLADGRSISIRLGRPEDAEGVAAMHERASAASRYQRYFTPMSEWREEHLRRITGGHRGTTLVVTDVNDVIIALGNVFPSGPQDSDAAEIALIVDDAWHGHGVGLLLMEHLIIVARRMGFAELVAYVLAENRAMLGLLKRTELEWVPRTDHELGSSVVCFAADL